MNVITHDAAYSLYPYATFELNSALVLTRDGSARTKAALEKYASRGFRMLDPRSPSSTYNAQEVARFFVGGRRQVDDCHSWIVPFKNASNKSPQSSTVDSDTGKADHLQGEKVVQMPHAPRERMDWEEDYEDDEDEDEDEEEYDDEEDECEEEEEDELDLDPIPKCRWRLCGEAAPLRVEAVDYIGAY